LGLDELLEPDFDPMLGQGPLPPGALDFAPVGGVVVCGAGVAGVVGVSAAADGAVELVVLGVVLVAAEAPLIPAAAPPAASAHAASVAPTIFEMRIFAPSCRGGWSRTAIMDAVAKRQFGDGVGVA
jgi:hypothetical protein